jgi:hypothetical protein
VVTLFQVVAKRGSTKSGRRILAMTRRNCSAKQRRTTVAHARDFRENLIVDINNPILIQKAWRDHHQDGWAYLAAPYGEDALTWNVFRSLDPTRKSTRPPEETERDGKIVQGIFGLSGQPEEMLFWGCDPDGTSESQQVLSICLRALDGQLKGNMTEPDLVPITSDDVCFVECKLRLTPLPWSAKAPKPPGDDPNAGEDEAEELSTPRRQHGWEK